LAPAALAPSPAASTGRYALGVAITVAAVLSQYFVPVEWPATRVLYGNLPGDLFVVYGIPILAFLALVGSGPLRAWRGRMGDAAWEGVRWYGALSILALAVTLGLVLLYEAIDPSALTLLNRPNPALEAARGNPWFFVALSFAVGAFEETIFRGWIFGFWSDRGGSWLLPATWTSAVFAGVHLYYGTTYGAASPLIFPTLFLLGFAFAATYRFSGGNLVVPALLHGVNDASAYLSLISPVAGVALHYGLVLVGGVVALVAYLGPDAPPIRPIG